jgi:sulfide:quinone oxidoreductase
MAALAGRGYDRARKRGRVSGSGRRVVVAGAGVAGLETALALRALAREFLTVELVAPEQEFTYRPLAVAEPFRIGEVRRAPLEALVRAAGARLRGGALAAIDAERKIATLEHGGECPYDVLVLALGARAREAIPGALTFRGSEDVAEVVALLARATSGQLTRIVFAMPATVTWPLPLYELALLTARYLVEHGTNGVEVVVVTPEVRPLALFGPAASDAIAKLLRIGGVRVETATVARAWKDGILHLAGGAEIAADAVVALPRLEGPSIIGLPQDQAGFVATDELGRLPGLRDVYAAGDLTQLPIKQGGIAAEQADAAASAIAADAGAEVRPVAFRPVLRGLLLTGSAPRFLRAEKGTSLVDAHPLWWPPAKIVGRYLSPFLAEHLGLDTDVHEPPPADAVLVEIALETLDQAAWSPV